MKRVSMIAITLMALLCRAETKPASRSLFNGKNRRIKNLTDNSEKPVGEWNTMIVECLGNAVKVWVNDDMVNHGTSCTASKGNIALQSEGAEVEFRKVELTPITKLSE